MKVFVTLYFGYCPLFWRLHNWGLNNKISSLHERIKYGDDNPLFQSLLERDRFTVYNDMLSELFTIFINWQLCSTGCGILTVLKDNSCGLYLKVRKFLQYLGPTTWDLVMNEIK